MDISVSSVQNQQQIANNAAQAGVAAPQTEPQKADYTAQRVTKADQSAQLEDNARNSEQSKFNTLKTISANFTGGENPFLSDISFTIYNKTNNAKIGNYEIRFTDLGTGQISVKSESELLASVPTGELVSGNV